MRHLKGNLISSGPHASPLDVSGGTGHKPVGFFIAWSIIVLAFIGSFGFGRLTRSEAAAFVLDRFSGIPVLDQMSHLVSSPDRKLAGESDDRINILLLGMGGEGHEGPNLTDTIMVASIKPSTRQVALLSVPRDLLVPVPDHGWYKINAVNAFGEKDSAGRGGDASRTVLEGLLGVDIPYYIRVDFNGFKDLVDGVGGVDIHVDRTFTDYTYPTEDYKVKTIGFKEGWQTMDGATALEYARSRHGNGGEGTDFARAQRQQKVLDALRAKMLSAKTYANPVTIANTLSALRANISTNLQIGELLRLARMAQNGTPFALAHKVLDNSPSSPLMDGSYGGAYVLVPKNDDWNALRSIAANLFTEAAPAVAAAEPKPAAPMADVAKPRVEIRNGTGRAGGARDAAAALAKAGFEVTKIGNADSFAYATTVIYDLTRGERAIDLGKLRTAVGDAKTSQTLPRGITAADVHADFLVILGGSAADGT
ncbi:MAG: hypothetical protein RLZZ324_800 [Candidatus Parcubacteria bacterium]|jgi:LCP family protein required for cell wall assembly